MEAEPGYLKASFFGFEGSGKTYTAANLALGLASEFCDCRPVAFFDTENAARHVRPLFVQNDIECLRMRGRTIDELRETIDDALDADCSVLIADSITHVWEDTIGRGSSDRHDFQEWKKLKLDVWAPLVDDLVQSDLHVIVNGRAGIDWEMVEVQRNGQPKTEYRKAGTKMKVEGQFGHEPSLLVEMTKVSAPIERFPTGEAHRAHVIKDRSLIVNRETGLAEKVLEGKSALDPDYSFFRPALIALDLLPAGIAEERREALRDIKAAFVADGLTDAVSRTEAGRDRLKRNLSMSFGAARWADLERMLPDRLREGLERLRIALSATPKEERS